jgi:hypothetical protein
VPFKKGQSGNPGGRPKKNPEPRPQQSTDPKPRQHHVFVPPPEEDILKEWRDKIGKAVEKKDFVELRDMLLFKLLILAHDGNDIRPYAPLLRIFPIEPLDAEQIVTKFTEFRRQFLAVVEQAYKEAANLDEFMDAVRAGTQGK